MIAKERIMRGMIDQKGSVTVIALVVLVAVTVLGITLINLSTLEQNMAGNERTQDTDFLEADMCIYTTAKYLRKLVDLNSGPEFQKFIPEGDPVAPGIQLPPGVTAQGLGAKLTMQTDPDPFYEIDPADNVEKVVFTPDIGFNPAVLPATGDIRPEGTDTYRGTAANEFDGGYSAGIGLGGAGGGSFIRLYTLICEGRGLTEPNTVRAKKVYARYRKVNIPGGL